MCVLYVCGDTSEDDFLKLAFPSTMWVLDFKLRLSDLGQVILLTESSFRPVFHFNVVCSPF